MVFCIGTRLIRGSVGLSRIVQSLCRGLGTVGGQKGPESNNEYKNEGCRNADCPEPQIRLLPADSNHRQEVKNRE